MMKWIWADASISAAPEGCVSRNGSGLSLPLEETVKLGKEGE